MSINRGMDKDVVQETMNITQPKKEKIESFIETWMNPEAVTQSEVS